MFPGLPQLPFLAIKNWSRKTWETGYSGRLIRLTIHKRTQFLVTRTIMYDYIRQHFTCSGVYLIVVNITYTWGGEVLNSAHQNNRVLNSAQNLRDGSAVCSEDCQARAAEGAPFGAGWHDRAAETRGVGDPCQEGRQCIWERVRGKGEGRKLQD